MKLRQINRIAVMAALAAAPAWANTGTGIEAYDSANANNANANATSVKESSGIKLGIQGGLNIAGSSTNFETQNGVPRKGFTGGILLETALTETWYLQPELHYIQKGSSADVPTATPLGTISPNVVSERDYLELPVLAKAKWNTSGAFKPSVFAGPAIAFLVSGEQRVTMPNGQSQTQDIRSNSNTTELSLQAGFGGEYAIQENVDVFADFRYSHGLTNVTKTEGQDIKNRGAFVFAGAKLAL